VVKTVVKEMSEPAATIGLTGVESEGPMSQITVATILTAVLVGITGYYAWQTNRMVKEMRRARGAQILPRIVPNLQLLGGGNAFLRIDNVGPGPALKVDVEFWLEPNGDHRRWRAPLIPSGDGQSFDPAPGEAGNEKLLLDNMTAQYSELRVTGACFDALGQPHAIDERLEIRHFWTTRKAGLGIQPQDRQREMAGHLDRIAKDLKGLRDVAMRVERRLDREE
jgi:hypothetical protein